MTLQEVVTEDLLKRELNSEKFISGLETCLSHTLSVDLASAMYVGKKFGNDNLIYPGELNVGDPVLSVGDTGEIYSMELYKKETGKSALDEEGTPTEEYANYVFNNSRLTLYHPISKENNDIPDYFLFNLHMNPGRVFPVKAEVEENHKFRTKRICKPVTICANASYDDLVELFFFQESSDKLQMYDPLQLKTVALELAIEAGTVNPDVKWYNTGRGYFGIKSKKVFFDFDLSKFAYTLGGKS